MGERGKWHAAKAAGIGSQTRNKLSLRCLHGPTHAYCRNTTRTVPVGHQPTQKWCKFSSSSSSLLLLLKGLFIFCGFTTHTRTYKYACAHTHTHVTVFYFLTHAYNMSFIYFWCKSTQCLAGTDCGPCCWHVKGLRRPVACQRRPVTGLLKSPLTCHRPSQCFSPLKCMWQLNRDSSLLKGVTVLDLLLLLYYVVFIY